MGPGVAAHELRQAMGTFVTGVTVVTAGAAEPHGITLNSLTSVSLEPPLVLISVALTSRLRPAVLEDGAYTVSVLSARLLPAARHFAGRDRTPGLDGFRGFATRPGSTFGHPVFADCTTWLECRLASAVDCGDHTLLTGQVVACGHGTGVEPLLFGNGALYAPPPALVGISA